MEFEKNLTVIEIRIKFLRDLKGITQKELADNLNVSQALINSWENGYADISLKQLVKLSYFYQVPIDYILGLITDFDKNIYDFKKKLDLKYLGNNLRIIRKIEDLTQEEFASIIHIERSGISSYERGKMSISSSALKEICNTFGYSADWCIGNTLKCIRRKKKIQLKDSDIKRFIDI